MPQYTAFRQLRDTKIVPQPTELDRSLKTIVSSLGEPQNQQYLVYDAVNLMHLQ